MIGVDASVAAKWVLAEAYSSQALALAQHATAARQPLVAPALLPFEVTNILRRQMVRAAWPPAQAERALAAFLAFRVTLLTPASLHRRVLQLADTYNLPAAYDAHYLALAEQLGCELWTDDQRLLRAVGGMLDFVRWIGDYQPPAP